jgi:uncharacterized membrane protein
VTITKWLAIAALFAVAAYLRLDALADPTYWYDEAITSLRVAGHTEQQVAAYSAAHPSFKFGELEQFVTVGPSAGFGDTLHSVATEDPQHTPLYYWIARLWAVPMGSSFESGRELAATAGLLALPAMYWLCLELFVRSGAFASRLVCWMGVTVMALSPYQVALSREHREYSLWTVTFTIACASFLRALRKQDWVSWALFAAAMTVSIYTHLFSALGLAACGVFLMIRERCRLSRPVLGFLAASVACGLACVPWMLVLLSKALTARRSLGWVDGASLGRFQLNLSLGPVLRVADLSIWDVQLLMRQSPSDRLTRLLFILTPVCVLVAAWILARNRRRACAGFLTALICSCSLTLFLMDYFTGSTSGSMFRYAVPSNLGWLLALAMLMAMAIEESGRWRSLGSAAVGIFVLLMGISGYLTHDQRRTWAKSPEDYRETAQELDGDGHAILVTDDFVGSILALAAQTRPDLPVTWNPRCFSCSRMLEPLLDIPDLPDAAGNFYYYRTWANVPFKLRPPVLSGLEEDRLGDPRFHTGRVQLTEPSWNLFRVTRRSAGQ